MLATWVTQIACLAGLYSHTLLHCTYLRRICAVQRCQSCAFRWRTCDWSYLNPSSFCSRPHIVPTGKYGLKLIVPAGSNQGNTVCGINWKHSYCSKWKKKHSICLSTRTLDAKRCSIHTYKLRNCVYICHKVRNVHSNKILCDKFPETLTTSLNRYKLRRAERLVFVLTLLSLDFVFEQNLPLQPLWGGQRYPRLQL